MRYLYCAVLLTGILPASLAAENLSPTKCPADTSLFYYEQNFANPTGNTDSNGPCSAGILNYSQFSFQSFGSPAFTDADIFLTPIDPGTAQTGSTGFKISGLSADPNTSATYVIDWYFAIDAGPYAGGAELGMDPPSGDVTITQSYCVDSLMSQYSPTAPTTCSIPGAEFNGNVPLQSLTVTVPNPNASITFDPTAQYFADVRTIIQLNGGDGGAGFDQVSGATDIYDAAPEPATTLLIPAVLSVLYFLRRRLVKPRA